MSTPGLRRGESRQFHPAAGKACSSPGSLERSKSGWALLHSEFHVPVEQDPGDQCGGVSDYAAERSTRPFTSQRYTPGSRLAGPIAMPARQQVRSDRNKSGKLLVNAEAPGAISFRISPFRSSRAPRHRREEVSDYGAENLRVHSTVNVTRRVVGWEGPNDSFIGRSLWPRCKQLWPVFYALLCRCAHAPADGLRAEQQTQAASSFLSPNEPEP